VRKKRPEEPLNTDRWLVSYADFITLLFAFFVVMYSMSSVNEGKYRVLSDSVSSAFRPSITSVQSTPRASSPSQNRIIEPISLEIAEPVNLMPFKLDNDYITISQAEPLLNDASEQIDNFADEVGASLETFINEEQVTLRKGPLWLEVEINSSLLFNSASAELSTNADGLLGTLGDLLSSYPNRLTVEGFTDNRPIQNSIYPSNWELSSARAASVIRLFESYGLDPFRMTAVGYGEFKPNYDNTTAVGRAQNRRVVIVIMADVTTQETGISVADLERIRLGTNN